MLEAYKHESTIKKRLGEVIKGVVNMLEAYKHDRRFKPNRKYDVKQLWESHHEILRQIVLGRNNHAIAEDLNITPQTVSNVRNNPLAKQRIEELSTRRDNDTMDIVKKMEEFAPIAEQLLEDIVSGKFDGASLALRAKYADKALGRVGYGEVRKIQSLHGTLSRDDIEDIKARALQSAREAGVIEDVEYESN